MPAEREHIFSGKIIDLVVDTVEVRGKRFTREVIRHPGGVVVLAELEGRGIAFVRQFRHPIEKELLELPAGRRNPGEEPEVSAARELEEETGLRPLFLSHISSFYPAPGFCDELLHLYYTDQVQKTEMNLEYDEELTVEFYPFAEALELALNGQIIDAKTLLALFWLDRQKRTS